MELPRFSRQRYTLLNYKQKPVNHHRLTGFVIFIGSGRGTRTPDPWIMIPLLYQLSYAAT